MGSSIPILQEEDDAVVFCIHLHYSSVGRATQVVVVRARFQPQPPFFGVYTQLLL